MARDIDIELWEPHAGQVKIQETARRFNPIVCGRRFGKTEFCVVVDYPLIAPAAFEGKKVGVFVQDFKDFSETWQLIVDTYKDIDEGGVIVHKDETKKRIKFLGGGLLEVWSIPNVGAKNKGRGRKYHRVIYEETQKIPDEVLEYHWKNVARLLLLDYKGDAYFIGTANGKDNFWYELCRRGAKNSKCERNYYGDEDLKSDYTSEDWYTHRMTTYANPHIPVSEIEILKDELDSLTFSQECLCTFVDYAGNPWVYSLKDLNKQRQVFRQSTEFKPIDLKREQLYISFDFNKIPMTAVVMKKTQLAPKDMQDTKFRYGMHFVMEFKIGSEERGEASIYDTCQAIREWVMTETGIKIGKWENKHYPCTIPFLITGDASGNRSDGRSKVPVTYYQIIQEELQLVPQQIKILKANPLHSESYVQVNTIIEKCTDFVIYEDKCPSLRMDTLRIKGNNSRQIVKAKGAERQADLLDCMRYALWTFCQDARAW